VYLLQIFLAAVVLGIGAGSVALPAVPTIFIAGDSTAAPGTPAAIQGWGTPFADFFDATKVSVVNGARGGRSSRTFITDGSWEQIISRVKAGDIVLIQFGHNDGGAINEEPPGSTRPLRARGSLPGLGDESREIDNVLTGHHEVVHTYGWYMRRMIAEVKAKGATPVLLSLTPRNYWTNGRIERGNGQYGAWTREIARTERVAFVDLTNFAADALEVMGEDETSKLFEPDRTHSNQAGAEFNAAGVVAGLKALRTVAVAPYLSAKGTAVAAAPASRIVDRVPALYLIGDSTVRNGQGDGANGQWGWGEPLVDHFDATKISVLNRAVGGLSSRTFLTLGHWGARARGAPAGRFRRHAVRSQRRRGAQRRAARAAPRPRHDSRHWRGDERDRQRDDETARGRAHVRLVSPAVRRGHARQGRDANHLLADSEKDLECGWQNCAQQGRLCRLGAPGGGGGRRRVHRSQRDDRETVRRARP
jgi:lysophospholipase L1-like esterase